jgi:TolA-binding protein
VQSAGGAEVRIQQLEDQLRQLNGRIEEMSFQLLQMQETIRKAQEDNEFRFQEIEKSGGSSAGTGAKPMKKSEADIPASSQIGTGAGRRR